MHILKASLAQPIAKAEFTERMLKALLTLISEHNELMARMQMIVLQAKKPQNVLTENRANQALAENAERYAFLAL